MQGATNECSSTGQEHKLAREEIAHRRKYRRRETQWR
jgi:hypothetical protein